MKQLEGKVALVTSCTRGIGKACALRLAEKGAKVYLAVRRPDAGEALKTEIEAKGGSANVVYFDADKDETFAAMVREAAEKEGRLDVLVNNFGTTDVEKDRDVLHTEYEDFLQILDRNLRSVFVPAKEAVAVMAKNGGGSIVNISSMGGLEPDLSRTAYGVSKAAINFLTQDLAAQYAGVGVRCNAVLPGFIATDASTGNMSGEFLSAFLKNVPLGRPGEPEDIAEAVAFLAGDSASFLTGCLLPVAGGFGVPTPLYGMYQDSAMRG